MIRVCYMIIRKKKSATVSVTSNHPLLCTKVNFSLHCCALKGRVVLLSTRGPSALHVESAPVISHPSGLKLDRQRDLDFSQSVRLKCQLMEDAWWRLNYASGEITVVRQLPSVHNPRTASTAPRLRSARSASARRSRWPPGDIWHLLRGPAAGQLRQSFSWREEHRGVKTGTKPFYSHPKKMVFIFLY